MKLRAICAYEVRHQLCRPSTWLYAAILLGLTIWIALEAYAPDARRSGYFLNSPFVVAEITLTASLAALMAVVALSGDAAARDVHTRMAPLVYTSSVREGEYFVGRFLGAFISGAVVLLVVPIGLLLAALAPWLDPEIIGRFRPEAYLAAYAFLALGNVFIATALLFSMALLARRAAVSYLGGILIFLAAMLSREYSSDRVLVGLLDPTGLTVFAEMADTWTSAEKSTRMVLPEGWLLANRLVWLGVALGVLALVLARFRFAHHVTSGWWQMRRRREARLALDDSVTPYAAARAAPIVVPAVVRGFGAATKTRQTLALVWESLRTILIGWGGVALLALAVLLVLTLPDTAQHLGVPLRPTTAHITRFIGDTGEILWMIIPLLVVYYSGELIWREREARMNEIIDASPIPAWSLLLGKLAGLALVLAMLQLLLMAGAMSVQAGLGHFDFEIALYLKILFGLQLPDYLLFALLAVVIHVLVDQKYVGHAVAVLAVALTTFAPALGIGHNLLVYGSDPGWEYSDMRGFDPFIGPWLWFKVYWASWALLLAVAARLLSVRGTERGGAARIRLARRRFTRRVAATATAAAALVLVTGGFIFYNTNVPNDYGSAAERVARRAEYERRYGRYAAAATPLITGSVLHVEILPRRQSVVIRGSHTLVNAGGVVIDSVHVATNREVTTGEITFDRPARLAQADDATGHRIYVLGRPLLPGDSLRLQFTVHHAARGFTNRRIAPSVAANGTFLESRWLPAIGYMSSRELTDAAQRRTHGRAPRAPFAALEDVAARSDIASAGAEQVDLEVVIGTDAGQIAVAPGGLRRTWVEGDRRYFHYSTDAPIRNDYAIFSAAYAVREAAWDGVALEVLHHPGHAWNVDRMMRSMQVSLDYHTRHFGPYPHSQLRLVEHPGRRPNLHAYPVNISFEEGFSLLKPEDDPREIDFPFAVVAHEVAHQWWGNRLMPALVEGSPLLTEGLAWYSALGVVEQGYGREHLDRLLAMMRRAYLWPGSRAAAPLLRSTDRLDVYRKGPFAMYALREYAGESRVNAALRRLLETHGSGAPPLPTSLDLYRELQAVMPDSLRYLLTDLFEKNTYWELAAREATAEQTPAGTWRVTLDVSARKLVVDTIGLETDVPMDDLVEVGVYGAARNGEQRQTLHLAMHRIRSGEQRLTVTVPGEPVSAGIDPRRLLIEVSGGDNVVLVRR